MSSFVRTTQSTHPLLIISKMVVVLLLIFFPVIALANPVFQSSSNDNKYPGSIRSEQSYRATPISYEMTHTATYQIGTTYNPAQTMYTPFSNETPGNKGLGGNGQSRISGRKNAIPNPGEPEREDGELPIGDAWSLLFFAMLGAIVIFIKQRKKIEAKG